MQDPNLAVAPDFNRPEFEEEREPFTQLGINPQQAADILARQWAAKNNKDKEEWRRLQQEANIAAAERAEREEQARREREEEEVQMLREERKKHKSKFAPIPNVPVPPEPVILLSQVAIRKIQQHKFCELWYFSNDGLDDADSSRSYALDDDILSFVPSADGTPALMPISSVREKANVIPDERLSVKQFRQAAVCIVPFMQNLGWDESHI